MLLYRFTAKTFKAVYSKNITKTAEYKKQQQAQQNYKISEQNFLARVDGILEVLPSATKRSPFCAFVTGP